MLLWWTRWTQGAMEQDHGWLAELQVRVQSLLLSAVALLGILSPIYITLATLRPRFSSLMISCSPSIFRLLLPASGSPPLLVPQRHCTPSPPPLSLIHSSPLSQLPTISTSHELRLWQGGVGGQAGWETQVHWKLPRLAPPARRH